MCPEPREVAIRILTERGDASRVTYFEGIADPRDRALARELATGTLKWRKLLDHYLSSFTSRPVGRLPARLQNALRVGAFQLLFTAVPAYAAVNSVVAAIPGKGERSFANGVLRSLSRNGGHLDMPSLDAEPRRYVAVRFSHPEWISSLFLRRFDLSGAMMLAAQDNLPPPLSLRVNSLRVGRDRYLEVLREAGYDAVPGVTQDSVRVLGGADVTGLPGFEQGLFVVQDEGAAAISAVVSPQPGDRVWDVCAAPGGKTAHLAEMMKDTGEILATDIDTARVEMVRQAASRLGLRSVSTAAMDATQPGAALLAGGFDRILLDAPCSGLGVLRRNADLRWNRRESDIAAMARRQRALLDAVAPHLRPGGTLVYSTCTLVEEENERVWTEFLRKHADLDPDDPARGAAGDVSALFSERPFAGPGYRYILPHRSGTDGFFVARAVLRS